MNTDNQSTKKQPSSPKKTSTRTKKTTTTTSGATSKKKIDQEVENVDFPSKEAAIEKSLVEFERLSTRVDNILERMNKAIEDIRAEAAGSGIVIPKLNEAIQQMNKFTIFKSKLSLYLNELRRTDSSVARKVVILSSMVELSNTIDSFEQKQQG